MLNIKTLHTNKWLSLKEMIWPEKNVPGYVFSHESRCNGQIVAILPYRYTGKGDEIEVLLRKEFTPCWKQDSLVISSITGGVEADLGPARTAVHEIKEEAGYTVAEEELEYLGTSFGAKSSDTVYHLFTIDLTGKEQGKPTTEDPQELHSFCYWTKDLDDIKKAGDPMLSVLYVRMEVSDV